MKKVFLLLTVALLAGASFAQGQEKAIKQYGFWDNWFIQGQLGGQYLFSEDHDKAAFKDKINLNAALGVGKYFFPEVGARLQLGGWRSGCYYSYYPYDAKYYNVNFDALFNLTNIFLSYKEDRMFNLIGIFGMGYVLRFKDNDVAQLKGHSTDFFAPRLGLQTDFRLNEKWSVNLEANMNFYGDEFNGNKYIDKFLSKYDIPLNILAGVTYRFANRGFKMVNVEDPALIQSLNDKINDQRGQIEEYKACCEKKQVVPEPKTIIKEVPAKSSLDEMVIFRIEQAKIDKNQEVNLYNVAQFMKANPDAKITVASYADKKTGTPEFNQKLSEKRSAVVMKILTEKYGIAKDRITVVNNGDKQQPFPDNNSWNRVTIMTTK